MNKNQKLELIHKLNMAVEEVRIAEFNRGEWNGIFEESIASEAYQNYCDLLEQVKEVLS